MDNKSIAKFKKEISELVNREIRFRLNDEFVIMDVLAKDVSAIEEKLAAHPNVRLIRDGWGGYCYPAMSDWYYIAFKCKDIKPEKEKVEDAEYVEYELWLGTFEGEKFKWKVVNKFREFKQAYKAYKDYVFKQMSYSDEELRKIWSSGRLDIELRQGKKLLNWTGIYSRKVDKEEDEEEEPVKDSDVEIEGGPHNPM